MEDRGQFEREVAELRREIVKEERESRQLEARIGSMGSIAGIVISLLAAVVVFYGPYVLFNRTTEYFEMRSWVPVSATLISFEEAGRGNRLTVKYRFQQGEKECTASRINIVRSSNRFFAEQYRYAYQSQQPITVYSNPERPCRAVIDRDFPLFDFLLMMLGVIGCAGLIFYIRRKSWKFD